MTVDHGNLKAHELIGLRIIVESSDPGLRGVTGIVRDETRNTLIVEIPDRVLTVPKNHSIFYVELPSGEKVSLSGAHTLFRPEDRVKRGA